MLETVTDGQGGTRVVCELCQRRERGVCRDCPAPVDGRRGNAIRCAKHKKEAKNEQVKLFNVRNHEEVLARARRHYQADPERRRRRNEYKRLYRLAHPEKTRAQKKRYVQRHGTRERSRYLDYHRRYNANAARSKRKRDQLRDQYYREHPVRPDPKCQHCGEAITWWKPLPGGRAGAPPRNCDKCCNKYELARRLKRRAAPRPEPAAPAKRPSLRVKTPQPGRYAETGERLCLTPGCDIVVTHRKKKCSRCRDREVREATIALKKHNGRGRRIDLERVA